jgi:hypothetical protein
LTILREKRDRADFCFGTVWQECCDLAEVAQVKLVPPRQANRQRHRANMPATSTEEYYRRAVFVPFLDALLTELNSRFESHSATVFRLSCLIPQFVHKYTYADLQPVVAFYGEFVESESLVQGEVEIWKQKWASVPPAERPSNALEALAECSKQFYPNVHTLLHIAATVPVTTATAERTFSTLKRIKTFLRTTMTTERLTGLALMNIHRNTEVDIDKVIDHFARKTRRLDFVL